MGELMVLVTIRIRTLITEVNSKIILSMAKVYRELHNHILKEIFNMTKRKKDYLNMQIQLMKELSMVTLSMEKESLQIPKAYI